MKRESSEMDGLVKAIRCVQRCKCLRTWNFVVYFLGIVGILGFCYFVIFSNHRNTLILPVLYFVFKNSKKILSHQWM